MSRFDSLSKEEVANQVRQWIVEEGLTVNDFQDNQADFNFVRKRACQRSG
ncbi:MAG TPA: hypothetical protein VFS97_04345 [Nitrososphaeraceae archaeon]|nr:hypothetical protein [Nitrososphaeraceae archaeon]